jgi:hypothetical protein
MWSADVFYDLDQLVEAVAVVAGEGDQLLCALDDGAAFGCPCHRDAAAPPELKQSLAEIRRAIRRLSRR